MVSYLGPFKKQQIVWVVMPWWNVLWCAFVGHCPLQPPHCFVACNRPALLLKNNATPLYCTDSATTQQLDTNLFKGIKEQWERERETNSSCIYLLIYNGGRKGMICLFIYLYTRSATLELSSSSSSTNLLFEYTKNEFVNS